MKDVELRLISELMKNSRKSDRELSKLIGVSQPTVTRVRNKLEQTGYIKEYTLIPDYSKLGYELMALTFVIFKKEMSIEEAQKLRQVAKTRFSELNYGMNLVMFENGIGLGYTGVLVSFHQDYSSYLEFSNQIRQLGVLESVQSFLIDLSDGSHYRSLTFSTLANHIIDLKKKEKE
jgi:DNA-binding Lrp family transcriptional regulator